MGHLDTRRGRDRGPRIPGVVSAGLSGLARLHHRRRFRPGQHHRSLQRARNPRDAAQLGSFRRRLGVRQHRYRHCARLLLCAVKRTLEAAAVRGVDRSADRSRHPLHDLVGVPNRRERRRDQEGVRQHRVGIPCPGRLLATRDDPDRRPTSGAAGIPADVRRLPFNRPIARGIGDDERRHGAADRPACHSAARAARLTGRGADHGGARPGVVRDSRCTRNAVWHLGLHVTDLRRPSHLPDQVRPGVDLLPEPAADHRGRLVTGAAHESPQRTLPDRYGQGLSAPNARPRTVALARLDRFCGVLRGRSRRAAAHPAVDVAAALLPDPGHRAR